LVDCEMVSLSVRIPRKESEKLEKRWKSLYFPNKSEYVRYVLRRELDDDRGI